MSGFAGIVRITSSPDSHAADRDALELLARRIAFRGPDGVQQWHGPGAALAFSLLRTGPAPQAAVQPLTIDNRTWLIGDVRLDRRGELIDALTERGQQCGREATDEEIVLRAWKLWRKDGIRRIFFDELYGDFSFALWEPGLRELHCFRDVMGGRPFYYCAEDGFFSFSNTLPALFHAPGFTHELDPQYIGDFLLVSWCPRPESTVYRRIRRLPAGHWLTFSPSGLELRRFQELPVEEPLWLKRPEEYVELYCDLLEKAVADRLPHAPAGIFLSGGLDSSTIAATACVLRKKVGMENCLHAVTADLQPLFDDQEGQWAAKVAEHLGIGFELIHRGDCAPFSGLEDLGTAFPEPLSNPFCATHVDLCRQSAAKARVVFNGYGGDNILTGQTWPYFVYLARSGRLGMALGTFVSYTLKHGRIPPLRAGIQARFRRWFGLGGVEAEFPSWLAPSFEREFDLRERWHELRREEPAAHPIHSKGYRTLADAYWPQSQDQEEAAYTGLPLELRSPLFDYRLLRFLLRLPPIPWCVDKEILRRAMRGALPEAILQRPKCPLAEDPLLLHVKKRNWRPGQAERPAAETSAFINWPEFLDSVQPEPDGRLWSYVPPIALDLWLKQRNVE